VTRPAGTSQELAVCTFSATSQSATREHQRLLNELNHRVKNTARSFRRSRNRRLEATSARRGAESVRGISASSAHNVPGNEQHWEAASPGDRRTVAAWVEHAAGCQGKWYCGSRCEAVGPWGWCIVVAELIGVGRHYMVGWGSPLLLLPSLPSSPPSSSPQSSAGAFEGYFEFFGCVVGSYLLACFRAAA